MTTPVPVPGTQDYREFVDSIIHDECVPFLGAGANLCGHSPSQWNPTQRDVLPLGGQLAGWLATQFGYPIVHNSVTCECHNTAHQVAEKPEDLLRISQYVVLQRKKGPLVSRLRMLLDHDYPPTALHRMLAAIPASLRALSKGVPHQASLAG
jgi:hypothetical protein